MHRHVWPQADGPALIGGDRALTYAELREAATDVAAGLEGFAGQRVLIVAPNAPEFVIALLAVWRAGAVAVPLGTRSREHELATTLGDSGAVAALAVDAHGGYSFATALAALGLPGQETEHGLTLFTGGEDGDPSDEEVAAILYTSGSTGAPKGAYLTHAAANEWGRVVAALLALTDEDRTALVIPAAHAFGLVSTLAVLVSGGTMVFVDNARSPEPLIHALTEHAVTILHGSPAVFAGLLETAPQALAGVRTGMVGGAASPPGLIERLDEAGARILNAYGMTEIGPACAVRADDPPQVRYETAGRALDGYDLRVQDGELQARGTGVTPGYHRGGEQAFTEDGWFRTGDLAELQAGDNVVVRGRAHEVIHVGGFNVFPTEVENFLLTHPDVAQAAVLGAPHPRMGHVVRAFVVARPGSTLTSGDVVRFARKRLAGYKVPYGVEVLDELPKLPGGKVDKRALAG